MRKMLAATPGLCHRCVILLRHRRKNQEKEHEKDAPNQEE